MLPARCRNRETLNAPPANRNRATGVLRKRSMEFLKGCKRTGVHNVFSEPHQLKSLRSRRIRNRGALARGAEDTVTCDTTEGRTKTRARKTVMSELLP